MRIYPFLIIQKELLYFAPIHPKEQVGIYEFLIG
jgi:hypothetical protein